MDRLKLALVDDTFYHLEPMTKPPPSPSPLDIQQRMLAEAGKEIREHEGKAAKFSTCGSASDGSGDIILTGRTAMGLTVVAIRMTVIQALGVSASLCGGLSQSMAAAQAEVARGPKS